MALLLRAVSQREALTPLALTVLAAVSYVPALYGGFVWDDAIFAEEPVIHAASGLRSIWFSPADIKNEGHYWPLVYSSFWLELDPHDTEVIDRLAALRFAEQRYEEAYRLYRTLAEITPDSAQTHSNLGATLYYLGRSEDALRSFERALSLDPDLEPARAGVRALTPD